MNRLVHIFLVGLGALTLAGCGSDERKAQSPAGRSTAQSSPEEQAQQELLAPTQPRADEVLVTAVQVDPALASACNITEARAFFEFDSANVREPAKVVLQEVADCLNTGSLKGRRVSVVGHANPRGTDQYNMQLGKSRAESVSEYLTTHGMDKAKVNTASMGERGSTATDERGFALERKVEIVLVK